MADQTEKGVEALEAALQGSGRDFVCDSALPGACVLVSFIGKFKGKRVRWNMSLATLAYNREVSRRADSGWERALFLYQFLEIHETGERVFQITVGLNLDKIDEPAIRKSIIMIRNYKRLALGRIEFGSLSP